MKVLIAAVALAAVVATPVLAQTAVRRAPAQQSVPPYDQSYGQNDVRPHSVNPAYDAYDGGHYVGSDPDPNVRQQLRRDYEGRW
jgi:hypothetical protein